MGWRGENHNYHHQNGFTWLEGRFTITHTHTYWLEGSFIITHTYWLEEGFIITHTYWLEGRFTITHIHIG